MERGKILNPVLSQVDTLFYISNMIQMKNRLLTWCAMEPDKHWTYKKIKDSKGKIREGYVPSALLKKIQTRLLNLFYQVYEPASIAHGFLPGKSTKTNAAPHVQCKQILTLDIKEFFPSIPAKKVYGFFRYKLGCNSKVASYLTKLSTYQDQLPQGSVLSPFISNCVVDNLDCRIGHLAEKIGCIYTRYADDIAISTKDDTKCLYRLKKLIVQILSEEGYRVNDKKVTYASGGRRKVVTGIVVNKKLNPKRHMYLKVRAMAHQYNKLEKEGIRSKILGKINYISSINPHKGLLLIGQLKKGYNQAHKKLSDKEIMWINNRETKLIERIADQKKLKPQTATA